MRMHSTVAVSLASLSMVLWSASGSAQPRGIYLSGRYGFAVPENFYQSNCGHASLAVSVSALGACSP
jgi:hypothetical protein